MSWCATNWQSPQNVPVYSIMALPRICCLQQLPASPLTPSQEEEKKPHCTLTLSFLSLSLSHTHTHTHTQNTEKRRAWDHQLNSSVCVCVSKRQTEKHIEMKEL